MTEKRSYLVQPGAGPRVAGSIVKAGDLLALTQDEAAYYLRTGELVEQAQVESAQQKTMPVKARGGAAEG